MSVATTDRRGVPQAGAKDEAIDSEALDALWAEFKARLLTLARNEEPTPTLVSIEQARIMLGVSRRTIYHRLDEGVLPSVYVGRRRLIPMAEIERLAAEGTGKPR